MTADAQRALFPGGPETELPPPPPPPNVREADVIAALKRRYGKISVNGDSRTLRFVGAPHVRLHPGAYGPGRVVDYLAVDTWRSSRYALHGHEVKVSRSDWLTELRDPDKADAFRRYCRRWWLVVPDTSIVRDDLPDGWGLMVLGPRGGVRVAQPAPQLDPEPIPGHLLASFARAIAAHRPGPPHRSLVQTGPES